MKTKITLVLALFFSLYSFGQVGTIFTSGVIKYKITATATVEVGQNYPISGVVIIPATVTYNSATYQVTSIGDYAFYGCSGLTSVTIPTSVTSIGATAFYGCSGLTSVTIPNSVTSIGENAFYECTGLTSVTIPNSVTFIGITAFYGCTGLTSVTIPTSVTRIEDAVFVGCTGLTSVTIPNSVTFIGEFAFQHCSGLTSVTIPNSLTFIGEFAFEDCTGLTSVTIPNSVTSIHSGAFACCSGLTSVTVNWTTPLPIDSYVFDKLTLSAVALNVPAGTVAAYDAAAVWMDFNPIIDNVTAAPVLNQTFAVNGINYIVTKSTAPFEVAVGSNTSFVGAATIPSSVTNAGNSFAVTSIGDDAFFGCTGLTSITMPNSLTRIGIDTFNSCTSLTAVTIPSSVTSIGTYAFNGCTGLTSLSIPNSVTSIEDATFGGCSGLTSVTIPNTVTSIGVGSFGGCTSLMSVTIGNSVTSIGQAAFGNCTSLNSITIPNSVTSIGVYAFVGCIGLTSVNIPNSVTSIGIFAFKDCIGLTSVTVNWTKPFNIYNDVFKGLTLSTITLNVPPGTEIEYNSTLGWTDFPSITDEVNYYCKGATAQPLTALFTPGSSLKWYTVAIGGLASTTATQPTTTTVGTKLFYVALVVNGIEGTRETITVNTIALPATPSAILATDAVLCKYIGTSNTVTYTVPTVTATTYNWTVPTGMNVIADASATDNSITVNFLGSTPLNTALGGVGTLSVRAISSGCPSALRSLVLTAKLPAAPTLVTLTSGDTNQNFNSGIPAVPTSLSDLEKITRVGAYMGTDIVFTLKATSAASAASYAWTLPDGVNLLTGDTSNEITVNFAGVEPGIGLLPIAVKSVGGCGESTLARTLNLSRALPTAPTALVLTDDAISSTPITKVSAYTGKLTPLTLIATPARVQGATATSYAWILPDGVNCSSCTVPNTIITVQQSVNTGTFTLEGAPIFEIRDFDAIKTATSTITINFADVAPETLSFPLTVFAVNGTGNSKARIRTVTAAAPTSPAITAVGGTTFNNCNSKTYSVLQTLGTSYTWTVPAGATYVQTGNQIIVDYNGVEATVGNTAQVTCVASNGTGSSAAKILNVKRVACLVRLANGSSANDFKVSAYPNPSSSEFTIETSAKGAMNLKVYDMQGRLVEKTDTNRVGSRLTAGTYNIIVNQGTNLKSVRVIKK